MKKLLKIICIVLLSIVVLAVIGAIAFNNIEIEEELTPTVQNYEEKIYNLKTNYVGDATSTSKIIQSVKLSDGVKYKYTEIEKIGDKNSVSAVYTSETEITKLTSDMRANFIKNSFIIFSLIENLDNINFCISTAGDKVVKLDSIQRDFAISTLGYDPYKKTASVDELKKYISEISMLDYKNMSTPANNIEDAITVALKEYYKDKFYAGEYQSVAHITMDTSENGKDTTAYVYQEYSTYQFENKIFERSAGSKCPIAISFTKDVYGNYIVSKIEEPEDGAKYKVSLQKIFPDNVITKITAIESDDTQKQMLKDQTITNVQNYLASIGRTDSKIALSYQEKTYPKLNEKNSVVYELLYKTYSEYPYYIGSIEKLENNKRYEYSTNFESQGSKEILTYTKKDMSDEKIIESVKLEIANGTIKPLEGSIREEYYVQEKKYKEDQKSAENYKN